MTITCMRLKVKVKSQGVTRSVSSFFYFPETVFTDRFHCPGRAVGPMCVCLSVSVAILTLSSSSPRFHVIGQSLWSQEEARAQ